MSKSKNDHGKSGGKDHDDRDSGHKDKGKLIVGTNGDDTLAGGSRNDLIIGRAGDDRLLGGGGNDILVGDGGSGGKHWFWQHCFWWKPKGQFDDYLDGGSGSDLILAGKGNDVANYTLSENKKSHDVYDGGKGFDTLQLTLTQAEFQLASVQKDIAAFEAFLAKKANPNSDDGKTFEFKSFNLDVRNFEALEILLPNRGPTAQADSGATNEDTQLIVAGPGLLANDSDPDASDVISIIGSSPLSAMGAVIFTNPDGAYIYDPSNALALQQLGQGESATDTFSYTIADLAGVTATATVSIVVTGVNDGPLAVGDAYEAAEDTPFAVGGPAGVLANDTDVDGDALHAILVSGPAHGTLGLNADGSFSYLAHADYFGNDSFTYRASDGTAESATRTVAIKVTDVNDAPVTAPDTFSVAEDGDAVGINVLGNDSAGPANEAGQALRVTGAFADHGSVAVNADGTLNYVAGPDFVGTDTIHYTASDNGSSNGVPDHRTAAGQVTVTVTEVNDAPLAFNDSATLAEDSANVVIDVLGNDSEGPANEAGQTLSVASATALHGLVLINADGTLNYTPEADYYGNDTISYTMSDDGTTNGAADPLSASAQVAVTVTDVNDAPVTAPDAFSVAEDGFSGSINVLGNDSAGPANEAGQTLAVDSASALHGTVLVNADGTLSYTPNADYFGGDTISYTASDNGTTNGAPDPRTALGQVAVTVTEVNDAPLAFNDSATLDEDSVDFVIDVLGNDSAGPANEAGQALSVASATALHGSVLVNADGTLSYTPEADYFGSDTISYTMSDDGTTSGAADPLSASAQVAVTVNPVNDDPVAVDDEITGSGGGEGGPIRVAVVGGTAGTYLDAAAQLADNAGFQVAAMSIAAFSSEADWTDFLADYDVVVVGENGTTVSDYNGTQIFAALRDFVDAGGGVITTGWFAGEILAYSSPAGIVADADYISPAAPFGESLFATPGSLIAVLDPAHPIAGTIASYTAQGFHELAGATDAGAVVLAQSAGGLAAMAYDEVGAGRTVYLGSLHMAAPGFFQPDATRTGPADQIFEQAVAWAAGDQDDGSGAATDEDTALVIDDAQLLANDTDLEGDALSIVSVSATSALGAAISLNADGDIVYDPTTGPQFLDDGEVITDTFTYTVSDGNGGTDSATVSLMVEGRDDTPQAEFDAASTGVDSVFLGNVLANDFDPEGDPFTLLTTGPLTTEYGALVSLAANGAFSYDPTGSAALQALPAGVSVVDFFEYTISDAKGGLSTGTASFTVTGEQAPGGGGGNDKILDSVPPGTPLEYYVRFEDNSPEWLRLEGFNMALSNSGSVGVKAGAVAGKATGLDINALLGSSQTLVQLTEALASGKHLKSVEIEAYRPGGEKGDTLVDQYYFGDVLVTGVSTGASEFSTASNLSFDYAKFNHGHVDYSKTGTVDKITEAGWDFQTNKTATGEGPAIAGDALKAKLDDALPLDAQLKYYVTYEGAGGWLELESFSMGLSNGGSIGSGGATGAGKLVTDGANLGLGSSAQILALTAALTSGKHFKDLEVEAYRSGGDKTDMLVDQYYFQDVLVSSLQTANASSNQVSVDFGAFSHGHIDYNANGTKGDVTEAGWSFIQNKDFSVPIDADFGGKDLPLDSVPPGTPLEYYVRFEDNSPEWLRLEGFNMALSNSGSVGVKAGAVAGKATGLDINALLGSSQTLVQLTEALASGKHLKSVEIEAYRPGGEKGDTLVDQYYFGDVLVTGVSTGASEFSTASNLSFDYAKFNHGHVDYSKTGTVDKITEAGWDFQTNKTATGEGPAIAGDALKAKLDDALPLDAQLKYYVTYEGAGGWLELESFSMGLSNGGSIGSGGATGAGKLVTDGANLGLGSSAQILALTAALTSGKHFKDLEVEAYRSGGDKTDMLVDQYYFQDVLVSSLQTANASSNQVSVDFGAFSHGHIDYNANGTKGDVTEAGWSFIQNKDFSVPIDADFGGKDLPLDSVPPGTPLEYYVRFEDNSPEWLRLEGFNMALSNSGSVGVKAGAVAGKATGLDINALLGSSQTLVQLTEALASGKHLKSVEIEAYRPGGEKGDTLVDQYYFGDVLVTGVSTGASEFSTASNLSFDYAKFNHGHVDYSKTGTVDKITEAGWDFQTNKTATGEGPAIAGDALKAKLDDALPLDAQLKYYVTYEGAGGWLELESFSMGLSNGGSIGSGGATGAGKLVTDGANLGLGSSAQILALTAALTSGKHFKDLEVEAYRSGGDKTDMLVDQYYFQDVLVSSLQTANASSNQVSVDFGAFSHGHIDYNANGTKGDVTEAGWSFIQNKDFSVPVDSDLF